MGKPILHNLWHLLLLRTYMYSSSRPGSSQWKLIVTLACDPEPTIVAAESEIHNVVGCTSTTTQLAAIVYFDCRIPTTASNIRGLFTQQVPHGCLHRPVKLRPLNSPFNSSSGSFSTSALILSKSPSNPQKSTSSLSQNNFKRRHHFQEHFYRISFISLTRVRPRLSQVLVPL